MWVVAALLALSAAASASMPCTVARARCMYRIGCGSALSNYMMMCERVLVTDTQPTVCPNDCSNALIALTSTAEGQDLMNCECEDDYCKEAKAKIDICRSQVIKGAADAISSCSLSQLICLADAQCSTALQYYHHLCRSMFRGRKCSKKCINSIEILRKQEKAAALTVCQCDGTEDYDCATMQDNLARLCFHKHKNHTRSHERQREKHKKVNEVVYESASSVRNVSLLLLLTCILSAYS